MSLNKNIDFNKVRELLKTEDGVIVDNMLDISFASLHKYSPEIGQDVSL